MGRLGGEVALVTGASRGIGAAAARALAADGAKVALAARTTAEIGALAEAIRSEGGEAAAVPCDVADHAAVADAVAETERALGPVSILVNNAGIIEPIARLADSDPDAWGRLIDVNVKGVYHGLRAVLPGMERRGAGVCINISSGAATNTLEGWSAYCTSKAAVLMLTRMVHKEYAGKGIRSVGLSPGTVATEMQAQIKASGVNPVSQLDWDAHIPPEWAGRAVAWLATEEGREFDGGDVSLRGEEIRRRIGLVA